MSKSLKVFITYAHKNTEAKDKLITYLAVLKQNGLIDVWHDNEILPGDKWRDTIFNNLADSNILLYLTCPYSLASENCNKELTAQLNPNIKVIPIILEHCDWQNHQLSDFQALPEKGKPIYDINEWNPESKGWMSVVKGIQKVVQKMQSQAKSSPSITLEEIETLAFLTFHRGNFMMMLHQVNEALKAYSRAIELSSKNAAAAAAYTNRGVAYGEKGELDSAIKDYTTAIKLDPSYAYAYNNRGYAYIEKDEIERAIKDLDNAIELKGDFAPAYNNRGYAFSKRDEIDNAINDFTKAIKLDKYLAEAYSNRGAAYTKKGEIDFAIDDLNMAIHLKNDYVQAYINRAGVYLNTGAYNLAIKDCDNAIRLDKKCAEAYNQRGNVYVGRREDYRAIDDFDIAIQLKENYPTTYYNRGVAYTNIGDFEAAIKDFTDTIQLNPDYIDAYYDRGLAHYKIGAANLSIQDYSKAIELDQHLVKAYKNRGLAFLLAGSADSALDDFSKVIEFWPNDAITYYIRATQVWLHRSEWEKAKADLTVSKSLGLDISALFNRDFGGVNNFENIMNIRLRADIASMLTTSQT